MAEYISFQPSDFFNTKLFTGTGSSNAQTGVGFQPDFTWIKNRETSHSSRLFDAVRGATKKLFSDGSEAEVTTAESLKTFDSDGFTVGTSGGVNANTDTFASWNWKANGAGSANTDGSISSTVSVSATSGFSIVKFTTDSASGNATIGHGLGVVPKMIIMKNLEQNYNWEVFHESVTSGGVGRMILNSNAALDTTNDPFGEVAPTSSVFTYNQAWNNASGNDIIAYCFAEVAGFSKFSSYTGNGSGDGTFFYTGFKPAFTLMTRTNSSGEGWFIFDSARGIRNVNKWELRADTSTAETDVSHQLDFLSNGVKIRTSGAGLNGSGDTYIYMAFAEFPIVSSNDIPCTAK